MRPLVCGSDRRTVTTEKTATAMSARTSTTAPYAVQRNAFGRSRQRTGTLAVCDTPAIAPLGLVRSGADRRQAALPSEDFVEAPVLATLVVPASDLVSDLVSDL